MFAPVFLDPVWMECTTRARGEGGDALVCWAWRAGLCVFTQVIEEPVPPFDLVLSDTAREALPSPNAQTWHQILTFVSCLWGDNKALAETPAVCLPSPTWPSCFPRTDARSLAWVGLGANDIFNKGRTRKRGPAESKPDRLW